MLLVCICIVLFYLDSEYNTYDSQNVTHIELARVALSILQLQQFPWTQKLFLEQQAVKEHESVERSLKHSSNEAKRATRQTATVMLLILCMGMSHSIRLVRAQVNVFIR